MTQDIYLDYNATTPMDPRVFEVMEPFLRHSFASPMSSHAMGREVKLAVEQAREQVAKFIGARHAHEVIFTSGGTESNNAAIFGAVSSPVYQEGTRRRLVTSVIEHPAVLRPLKRLAAGGYALELLPVDESCRIVCDEMIQVVDSDAKFVSLMHANNEVGAVQPVAQVGERCREYGVLFHVDGAQAAGKLDVNVQRDVIDLYTLVGHKFYGPKGIGALYVRDDIDWSPSMLGAGHEFGRRAGTHHVAGAVGLGKACELASAELEQNTHQTKQLSAYLWDQLSSEIPDLHRTCSGAHCLSHVLHVCFPGVIGAQLLERAEIVMASTGSACHKLGDPPSSTLLAMGVDEDLARGSVRLSMGHGVTEDALNRASAALVRAYKELLNA